MHKQHIPTLKALGPPHWTYEDWMLVYEVVLGHRSNCNAVHFDLHAFNKVANASVHFYNK